MTLFGSLFGSRRKRVTGFVLDAVAPAIDRVLERYGLPPDFWIHPYVLGFLNGQISAYAKYFGQDKLDGTEISNITVDVIANLSTPDHERALEAMVELGKQQDNIFNEADGNGYLVALYTFDVINDPKTTGVKELVHKTDTTLEERVEASTKSIQQFWFDEIEKQLGLGQANRQRPVAESGGTENSNDAKASAKGSFSAFAAKTREYERRGASPNTHSKDARFKRASIIVELGPDAYRTHQLVGEANTVRILPDGFLERAASNLNINLPSDETALAMYTTAICTDDDLRKNFLSQFAQSRYWKVYFEPTDSGNRWNILVEYGENQFAQAESERIIAKYGSLGKQ